MTAVSQVLSLLSAKPPFVQLVNIYHIVKSIQHMSAGNSTERKGIFSVSSSPNVRVDRIPVKGRVLVAQKEFQPGDEIFSVPIFIASFTSLLPDSLSHFLCSTTPILSSPSHDPTFIRLTQY